MPSAGALVALVVLVTAGAALADEPAFKPARLVSRFEPQKPANGAVLADEPAFKPARLVSRFEAQLPAADGARSARPEDTRVLDVGYTADYYSDWFIPIRPEAGKKQKATLYFTNWGDKCGDTGEVNYKLPELAPLQTKAIKASWKMPDTPGVAVVLVFVDSACTAFNQTGEEGQASFYTTVVEAGTEYAYLQVALPYNGDFGLVAFGAFSPMYPPANSTYTANIPLVNLGTAPSVAGVKMGLYTSGQIPENASTDCTYPGEYSADIPKIGPGKTKVVAVEGMQAPLKDLNIILFVFTDITTTPKKPKINGTMTVKVKITNVGDAEGPVGRIVVFTTSIEDARYVPLFIGYRCDPILPEWVPGSTYSFNTTGIVIKAGKSKTVKITDMPVPDTAGWWGLTVVPDADCINEAEGGMFAPALPYSSFEAVAP
ncbi:hypothetical protein Rsub_02512 [Raphidocelis subcapitata]|uniref:CARDB domain-containing protein n=1 Tax=Raphidocelis subcapitata TaxID=307507 RepID=A0A2V0NQ81_9CHLO|nr:hypothetical protein Rsub_02512 [Raphidocelis subcapitata]|eukprot:GBF89808.1 hypothetical protein Rsub_02512 [Raphidocelis subcapitata]